MRRIPRTFLGLSVALLALATAPLEAAAKCGPRTGSPVLPGYVFIVDGEVVGEFAMDEQPAYPPSEQVLALRVTCLRARGDADPRARQAAVVVVTKQGAEKMLTSYLDDLVAAQEKHRASTGEYARELADLDFFSSHIEIPLQMDVGDGGFAATATLKGSDAACRVAVGSRATDSRRQRARNTPVCWRR